MKLSEFIDVLQTRLAEHGDGVIVHRADGDLMFSKTYVNAIDPQYLRGLSNEAQTALDEQDPEQVVYLLA